MAPKQGRTIKSIQTQIKFQMSCRPKYMAVGVHFLYRMNNKVRKEKKLAQKI